MFQEKASIFVCEIDIGKGFLNSKKVKGEKKGSDRIDVPLYK